MDHTPSNNQTNLQLQRARELLAQGQSQEALVVALDALQGVLQNLRSALLNLQRNLAQVQADQGHPKPSNRELEALATLWEQHLKKDRTYH
uniref:Uncharacterized protein n=1 Tax=Desulfobacca acetoxidans TaxID=60893 RepID=A0A7V4G6R6_9BACT